jgi:outer membrane lipoprotein-sorting protein
MSSILNRYVNGAGAGWIVTGLVIALLLSPIPGEAAGRSPADEEMTESTPPATGEGASPASNDPTADLPSDEAASPSGEAAPPSDEATPPSGRAAPDLDRLLRRLDELYESSGTTSQIEITITKPEKTRTMRLRAWTKGDDKALIVVDAPARDAGTATLKVGKNLWNYLPKISRTIRVPPSMMMGSWMGTDLTNDDIVRESSYEEDYTSELVGESSDPQGWLVRLTARPDVAGLWNRVDIVFSYDDELPVEARYFDRKDRLSRTMRFGEVKTIGGRRIPTLATIIPEREEGRSTELRYLDVEFGVDLDDDIFSLSRLERRQ